MSKQPSYRFVIDKRFTTKVERTERVIDCAEAFGVGLEEKHWVIYDNLELNIKQGDIVYITGQSGSGKSLLLRDLGEQFKRIHKVPVANIDAVHMAEEPLLEQLGKNTNEAIRLLNLAGLNDAYLFIRKPSELSDGQRYRFRIALLLASDAEVWVADEFGAVLDRTTARVVAYNVQRQARRHNKTLIVATTHRDMVEELGPNLYVDKRFKEKLEIKEDENACAKAVG